MALLMQIPQSTCYFEINESRIHRLLSEDKKYAIYMGVWDKIKEFFRPEKKSEAIEQLYDFIHNTNADNSQVLEDGQRALPEILWSFDKLKSLAFDNQKELFRIVKNPYDGLDFCIGSNVVKSVDSCYSDYCIYTINTNDGLKDLIQETIYNVIDSGKPATKKNLDLDIARQWHGCFIDGQDLSGRSISDQEKRLESLNTFFQGLSLPQQTALPEIASQTGFANVFNALNSFKNDFWDNFSPFHISQSIVLYTDEITSDITLIHTIRRTPDDLKYQEAKSLNNLADIFPTIQMDVGFTLTASGGITCPLFYVSDTIRPPLYSLGDLNNSITL